MPFKDNGTETDEPKSESKTTERIRINDLFHIIDLCGRFLNKAEPDDDDQQPAQLFFDHAQYNNSAVSKDKHARRLSQE